MAKVSFTKLGLKVKNETKSIIIADQEIEIKQYLPVNDKLELISRVINLSSEDDMKFYNVGKMEIFLNLEILFTYTNINFTDKQKEDVCKLFDLVESSGLLNQVLERIPEEEIEFIKHVLLDTVESIYNYQNSVMGILDNISQDYSALNLDASEIQAKLADPENMALLKSVLTRLG